MELSHGSNDLEFLMKLRICGQERKISSKRETVMRERERERVMKESNERERERERDERERETREQARETVTRDMERGRGRHGYNI